jgi:thiamine-phosphate pyrophosphorylase
MNSGFHLPRLYPIIDTALLGKTSFTPQVVATELIAAGARIIQYRHKGPWQQSHFHEAQLLRDLCRAERVEFILNDRADYANLLGAGLHIGQDDLPPPAARQLLPSAIFGLSTHNGLQLRRASEAAADYLSLGPIFATTSKERPDPTVGLDGLGALRVLVRKPLVAIGGITLENARQTLEAGADSVAVISGLLPSDARVESLRERLGLWARIMES